MKATAWHRVWFNFGGINREVTIRPLGASEVDAPGIVTRLLPDRSALVDVTAQVRNRGDARDAPAHRPPRGASAGVRAGQARQRALGDAARPAPHRRTRTSGPPATRRCRRSSSPSRASPAGGRRSASARSAGRAGACCSTAADRPARRVDPRGRPGPRRRAAPGRHGRDRRRLKPIRANATRSAASAEPGAARAPRRRRHHGLAGHRPGRLARRLDGEDAGAAPPGRCVACASTSAGPDPPDVLTWNLANEVAGNGHAGGQAQYVDRRRSSCTAATPGGRSRSTSGARTCPRAAGLDVPPPRRDRRHELRRLVRRPAREPGGRRRGDRRLARALHATFPGKVLVVTEFGAEANTLNPPARAGRLRLPGAACSPATSAPTRRSRG